MQAAEVLAAAVPVAWDGALSGLGSAFWALRLSVWAILVGAAWIRIIEEEGRGQGGLTRKALLKHDAASEQSDAASESIADWSLCESSSTDEEGESVAAAPQTRSAAPPQLRPAAAATPAAAAGSAVGIPAGVAPTLPPGPRPPVSAAKVPTSPTPAQPLPAQRASLPDEVLPDEVAEVAADSAEKEALAGAVLMDEAAEGVAAGGKGRRGRKSKKRKKTWLARKFEGVFKPFSEKTHMAGYMVYKGMVRMGGRVERGTGTLGKQLNGAIRDVGAEAVDELEGLVKKWVKFFGVVTFLTVGLLPLPSVHITLAMH